MQARLKWWLIGIIALAVISLLSVLRPITIADRLNLEDGKPIMPQKVVGPFKLYTPYPDIRLGLDLRGGTQLRLQCQKSAIFTYDVPEVVKLKTDEARSTEQGKIADALPESKLGGKRDITVRESQIEIRTRVKDKADMDQQQATIDAALRGLYADARHIKGSPEFKQVSLADLRDVMTNLENRINVYGVSEAIFQAEPPDKILVELPGVKDPERARELLQSTAVLEFRYVPAMYEPTAATKDPKTGGEETTSFRRKSNLPGSTEELVPAKRVLVESRPIGPNGLTGRDMNNDAQVLMMPGQETSVIFSLKPDAARTWGDFTKKHIGQYVAVVLDGKIISCPIIKTAIMEGETSISGGFNGPDGGKRANMLKIQLNAGALPVDIVPVEQREVSATLGKDSLNSSLIAGGFGFLLILLFMVWYYRLPGVLACAALIIYCILLIGALKAIDATLTLPGIFGIILSIGMAVDANIIIFERLKEELRAGKTMRAAIEAGFKRAWTAILDANVCSILTGIVLYLLGTGPVKGFAVTLVVGVAVSMFTAITVTRLFMDLVCVSRFSLRPSLFGVAEKDLARMR
jgi:protein-export membrane protein SecD